MRRRLVLRRSVVPFGVGATVLAASIVAAVMIARSSGASAEAATPMSGMTSTMSMEGSSYWRAVSGAAFPSDGRTRTYYIRADEVVWNYAPLGRNMISGRPFDAVAIRMSSRGRGGSALVTSNASSAATRTRPSATCRHAPRMNAISASWVR